jgi:hypothetical protein
VEHGGGTAPALARNSLWSVQLAATRGVTFLLSFVVGLVAGMAPALQAIRADLTEPMRDSGQHGSSSRRKARARSLLVVIEVALALLLVVVAGLLARSLSRVLDAPLGLDPENVLTIRLNFPGGRFKGLRPFSQLNARLMEKVAAIPGVESAGSVNAIPLTNAGWDFGFRIEGRPPPPAGLEPDTLTNWVSPGFFRTLRIPLIDGRELNGADTYQSPKVMVVNEAFARRFFLEYALLHPHAGLHPRPARPRLE